MQTVLKQIVSTMILFFSLVFLTGFLYPLLITAIGQIIFPWRANGSLIEKDHRIIGSVLIGQYFSQPGYFWGRPSSTPSFPYNALHSGGSNYSTGNPILLTQIQNRIQQLRNADPTNQNLISADLVMASGSGLDPDISIAAAYYQIPRIAKARHVQPSAIQSIVDYVLYAKYLRLTNPRLNVLELNLMLDNIANKESYGASST